MRGLRITADDFGLCPEVDEAICLLHDRGIVDRTALIANTEQFEAAVQALRLRPRLEVAIHLNLTDGCPVRPPHAVPSLVNRAGRFRGGRHYSVACRLWLGLMHPEEVRSEWAAQIERAKAASLDIVQLTSHGHVHLLPPLHTVVVDLLQRFAIPSVRVLSGTSLRGVIFGPGSRGLIRAVRRRGLAVTFGNRSVGVGRAGAVDEEHLRRAVESAREQPTELIVHPAVRSNPYHRRWGFDGQKEVRVLLAASRLLESASTDDRKA